MSKGMYHFCNNYDEWVELFDGTDCEGWWD